MTKKPEWTAEAKERMKNMPFFIRGFAKRKTESEAIKNGITVINAHFLDEIKKKEMPN